MKDIDTDKAYAVKGGNIYYDPNTGMITVCDGSVTHAVIPNAIDGVKITGIGGHSFFSCFNLESVHIPESVVFIGGSAFENCKNLKYIFIPNSVEYIGEFAFKSCRNLKNISLPNGIVSVEKGTFECCTALQGIFLPSSVKSIGESAFENCFSLTYVSAVSSGDFEEKNKREPAAESGSSVGRYAFFRCKALKSVFIPNSITYIDKDAFYYCPVLTKIYRNVNETLI